MLEAKLAEASVLKKLLDAIKELVTDANFECSEEGITLQAMDNSHVALVAVKLVQNGFKKYRCDRPMPLGVNVGSLTKVLKCAKDDDICTLSAADEADVLNLVYEAKNTDRIASYELKLMDIDSETLGIPKTAYDARVVLSSSEFTRIVRDLSLLGDSVRIEVSKEGVRFASDGEAANGSVLLKGQGPIGKVERGPQGDDEDDEDGEDGEGNAVNKEKKSGDNEDEDEDGAAKADENDDDEEGDEKKAKKTKVKREKTDDGDVEMNGDEGDYEPEDEEREDDADDDDDDDEGEGKKRKKKSKSSPKPAKKAKTAAKSKKGKGKAGSDDEPEGELVVIQMNSHVSLTFSLKYLVNFSKSASLVGKVELFMSNDVPLLVSYDFGQGYIRYYLAPKIGDD